MSGFLSDVILDGLCEHEHVGRITAGDLARPTFPHASTSSCAEDECVARAQLWALINAGVPVSGLIPFTSRGDQ